MCTLSTSLRTKRLFKSHQVHTIASDLSCGTNYGTNATSFGSYIHIAHPYHLYHLGNFHNLALSKTGKLWSWGSGCLGRGDEIYDSLPQPVEFFHALGRNIKQVFAAG